jgi:outer membrane protein assembly factor BamE (lipoprotein component of BamABCDE complex)
MALALTPLLLCAACAPPAVEEPKAGKGNLTLGGVQTRIVNGSTTKAQVMEWFGSPNLVTRNKDGEVWNYTRQGTATELKRTQVGAWFLLGSASSGTGFTHSGSCSFDLLLRFDLNDVVTDHKVLQTAF